MDWALRLARLVSVSASSGGEKSCPIPSVAASIGASLARGLEEWSRTIRRLSSGWRDAFVYFKHEEAGTGPAFARQLQAFLDS
jgi:hypothetical protein